VAQESPKRDEDEGQGYSECRGELLAVYTTWEEHDTKSAAKVRPWLRHPQVDARLKT
jgi:hypothetical protein